MSQSRVTLRWRHTGHDSVSNHQPHNCLLNRLFRRRSKETSKFRVTGLCAGNSTGTGEFPAQMASYAENVSIWWRHHEFLMLTQHPLNPFQMYQYKSCIGQKWIDCCSRGKYVTILFVMIMKFCHNLSSLLVAPFDETVWQLHATHIAKWCEIWSLWKMEINRIKICMDKKILVQEYRTKLHYTHARTHTYTHIHTFTYIYSAYFAFDMDLKRCDVVSTSKTETKQSKTKNE